MLSPSQTNDPTIASTQSGRIQGVLEDDICVWKGIPYARPPVEELRWKAPQDVEPWQGVRRATTFGNICPQTSYSKQSIYEIPPENMSEDCLYLNIWALRKPSKKKRPVFIWIHGGSLTREGGTYPQYFGKNLAKKGLVYVSINYRLNAFGFLAHPHLSAENKQGVSGNYGILDQIKALEWVRDNITAFGGDPGNVTIAGESAGGWSVTLLTATRQARGLFHKAIAQSGVYLWPGPHLKKSRYTYVSGEAEGMDFMQKLGAQSLNEMREIPAQKLVDLVFSNESNFSSKPVIDGYLFEEDVFQIYAKSRHNRVNILTGANADEWSLWIPKDLTTEVEQYKSQIRTLYPKHADLHFAIYPVHDSASIAQAHANFQSDQTFHLPIRNWASAIAAGGNRVFMYYFSKVPKERYPKKYGAFHGAEIVYALDNLENDPGLIGNGIPSEADQEYADQVSAYWVNFAKTGNPNGPGLIPWPEWDASGEHYLAFDDQITSQQFLLKYRLDALERFLNAQSEDKAP